MAKQPNQAAEASALGKRKAELASLNADIAAVTKIAEEIEESSLWIWDAWCIVEEMSEREFNDKLYDGIEKLYNHTEEFKAEVEALLKTYKGALPTLTRLVESHNGKNQEVKAEPQEEALPAPKKAMPTKTALIEDAQATLAAKDNKAKKVVRTKARR